MGSEASIRVETPLLFVGLALQSLAHCYTWCVQKRKCNACMYTLMPSNLEAPSYLSADITFSMPCGSGYRTNLSELASMYVVKNGRSVNAMRW